MDPIIWILVIIFAVLLVLNVPIAVAIAVATIVTALVDFISNSGMGMDLAMQTASKLVANKMATGIDSFSLLAIPFFILAGQIMGRGGLAMRLIDFANALVGRFTGGLAYVTTISCMMFGAISGSAVAAISSIGAFLIPEMEKKGYNREFNVSIMTTAATTGLVIPPSNIMIVFALVSGGQSIAALFIAGILPGILVGIALMFVAAIICMKAGYGKGEAASMKQVGVSFLRAVPPMLLIVIVLGGILGGIFTATEAAAIAVAYAFLLAVVIYREVKLKEIPAILVDSSVTTAIVLLLVGASMAMSYLLTIKNIPQELSALLLSISDNKYVILLIINIAFLIVGTFMDMTPAVLIFTPIFLPVVTQDPINMHPIHFGIMMIVNLCIGLCTPPVGTCLFVGCGVGKTTIAKVVKPMIPFFIAMFVALMIITYVPKLSLWLPEAMKLIAQ